MKIGDEVYVHGYVDEIRKDVVIIRNEGGYFGTVEDEIVAIEIKALNKDYTEPRVVIEQTEPQEVCPISIVFSCEECMRNRCPYAEQTEPKGEE